MIESIWKLGSPSEFPIKYQKRKGERLIAKVIFNLDEKKLEYDKLKFNEERAKEYLWIGNVKGNHPQVRLTTGSIEYLLDPNRCHKWSIKAIEDTILKNGLTEDHDINELYKLLHEIRNAFFEVKREKSLIKEFKEICKRDIDSIECYTLSVKRGGNPPEDLAKSKGYKKLLDFVLYTGSSERIAEGKCFLCGKEGKVLVNPDYPKGTLLSMYVIDKAGFLSNVDKSKDSLLRTHAVCIECKKRLVSGENCIRRHLSIKIGEISGFLIPSFPIGGIDEELRAPLLEKCEGAFSLVSAIKSIEEVEKLLNTYRKDRMISAYSLYIVFGEQRGSHFACRAIIQNVPITRLIEVAEIQSKLVREMGDMFEEDYKKWLITFEEIYYIFPIERREERGRARLELRPILELFDSILRKTTYLTDRIIKRALMYVKILRYGTFKGYNIKEVPEEKVDEYICRGMIKYNMLIRLLQEIGVTRMQDITVPQIKPDLDEELIKFIEMQRYTEWQTALFLLGVLIGKVGIEQYKKGDEKKAILNKVRFEGMSSEAIKRLSCRIIEDLRNYRILPQNEKIYGYMKELLDRNIEKLNNNIDNVFYLLSGYAFMTLKAITSGR